MSNYFVAVFLLAFMGALAGFLVLNFHPASIFMGDCGSLFIGFIMSIVGILGTYYGADSPTLYPVVTPLLILAVPLFDIFSVMAIRIRRGVSIFAADKNHFSHRLVDIGMNVRTAAVFLYIVTFCVGLPSVLLPLLPAKGVMIVFVQTLGVMSIIGILEYYGKKR
jgi:UDP-GlcNAc:undecaprenyl-phosphate GlcNAc-1-phosphate transferase